MSHVHLLLQRLFMMRVDLGLYPLVVKIVIGAAIEEMKIYRRLQALEIFDKGRIINDLAVAPDLFNDIIDAPFNIDLVGMIGY